LNTDKEALWFQSEVAAGRYLKAAIAAGRRPTKPISG
jgi:hypothetical protein